MESEEGQAEHVIENKCVLIHPHLASKSFGTVSCLYSRKYKATYKVYDKEYFETTVLARQQKKQRVKDEELDSSSSDNFEGYTVITLFAIMHSNEQLFSYAPSMVSTYLPEEKNCMIVSSYVTLISDDERDLTSKVSSKWGETNLNEELFSKNYSVIFSGSKYFNGEKDKKRWIEPDGYYALGPVKMKLKLK